MSGERQGQRIKRLHRVCPRGAERVWGWFVELRNGLRTDERLTYTELASWASLARISITPEEIEWLRRLDSIHQNIVRSTRNA